MGFGSENEIDHDPQPEALLADARRAPFYLFFLPFDRSLDTGFPRSHDRFSLPPSRRCT